MYKPFFNQFLRMNKFSISIKPQYVRQTEEVEVIAGKERLLHEVQKRMKLDFEQLPEFTIITAPTGTGKSYAFPFPVLNAKKRGVGIDNVYHQVRGLIVLPTNALISELTESFQETYPQLEIQQLTGLELNKHGVSGYERWKKALELAANSDLVITNPDLINYAMHGGYHQWAGHKHTGETRFSAFLEKFNYIIFDEYHLYDEAQIANILTMIKLRRLFLAHYGVDQVSIMGIRFLFVSATPENGLKQIFTNEGYDFEEIIEKIVSEPTNARSIHGTLEVEFIKGKDIKELIRTKIPELKSVLPSQKALIILDTLRAVQELASELRLIFEGFTIYESTGYVSKNENPTEAIKKANLILATNKAEVGVNYDVEYCIMQPGRYFQNFVQRFGRVSRGSMDGKVIICIDKKYRKLKRAFKEQYQYGYYDFLEIMRKHLQGRAFYVKWVPMFMGEYLWCIANRIRRHQEFNVWRYFQRRLKETDFFKNREAQRFFVFQAVHDKVSEMMAKALYKEKISPSYWDDEVAQLKKRGKIRTWEWAIWWKNYIDTYLTFRDNAKVVKIFDRINNEELEYSLDWILQHKVIEHIEVLQEESYEVLKYTVGNLKDQEKDLQYTVSTLPNAGMERNNLLSYQEMYELDKVFRKAVERIYDKVKKGIEEIDELQVELCKEVSKLGATFDRKRLKIESIDNNDMFM